MDVTGWKKAPRLTILNDSTIKENLCIDDDLTVRLRSKQLPLDVQLMMQPMWTLRSRYHDSMQSLDKTMEMYRNFKSGLSATNNNLQLGTATNMEMSTAFDKILYLMYSYDHNQAELNRLHQNTNHQLSFYTRILENEILSEEMHLLRDIDYIEFTRKTYSFEHIVKSLFQLVRAIEDSLKTSRDISHCCVSYLIKISEHFNLPGKETLSPVNDTISNKEDEKPVCDLKNKNNKTNPAATSNVNKASLKRTGKQPTKGSSKINTKDSKTK